LALPMPVSRQWSTFIFPFPTISSPHYEWHSQPRELWSTTGASPALDGSITPAHLPTFLDLGFWFDYDNNLTHLYATPENQQPLWTSQ
jgi:hypothetical protein